MCSSCTKKLVHFCSFPKSALNQLDSSVLKLLACSGSFSALGAVLVFAIQAEQLLLWNLMGKCFINHDRIGTDVCLVCSTYTITDSTDAVGPLPFSQLKSENTSIGFSAALCFPPFTLLPLQLFNLICNIIWTCLNIIVLQLGIKFDLITFKRSEDCSLPFLWLTPSSVTFFPSSSLSFSLLFAHLSWLALRSSWAVWPSTAYMASI